MRLKAIDHVQLAMPNGEEAKARRFYGEVLGLSETAKPASLAARGGCWFERDELKVHLGVDPDFRPARKAHVAFSVTDLDGLLERARAEGLEVVDDADIPGVRRAFVFDPFGNRLEFIDEPNGEPPEVPRDGGRAA